MSFPRNQVEALEKEMAGFNRQALGLVELRKACDRLGILLLVEPFPGQGLYFIRRGVPVLTVNRRLESSAGAFFGFWGLFLHRLRPGAACFFRNWREPDDPVLFRAGILASVALVPGQSLLEPLPPGLREGPASSLMARFLARRIEFLIRGEQPLPLEQAL